MLDWPADFHPGGSWRGVKRWVRDHTRTGRAREREALHRMTNNDLDPDEALLPEGHRHGAHWDFW